MSTLKCQARRRKSGGNDVYIKAQSGMELKIKVSGWELEYIPPVDKKHPCRLNVEVLEDPKGKDWCTVLLPSKTDNGLDVVVVDRDNINWSPDVRETMIQRYVRTLRDAGALDRGQIIETIDLEPIEINDPPF